LIPAKNGSRLGVVLHARPSPSVAARSSSRAGPGNRKVDQLPASGAWIAGTGL
jgi:hypothetical protein